MLFTGAEWVGSHVNVWTDLAYVTSRFQRYLRITVHPMCYLIYISADPYPREDQVNFEKWYVEFFGLLQCSV